MMTIKPASVLALIGVIAAYSAIYAVSMWTIGMNEREKRLVLSPLKKLRGAKRC